MVLPRVEGWGGANQAPEGREEEGEFLGVEASGKHLQPEDPEEPSVEEAEPRTIRAPEVRDSTGSQTHWPLGALVTWEASSFDKEKKQGISEGKRNVSNIFLAAGHRTSVVTIQIVNSSDETFSLLTSLAKETSFPPKTYITDCHIHYTGNLLLPCNHSDAPLLDLLLRSFLF